MNSDIIYGDRYKMYKVTDIASRVDVVLGNTKCANILQPVVNLNLTLGEENEDSINSRRKDLNLMLNLKSLEELRYSVAKALSATDKYKIK